MPRKIIFESAVHQFLTAARALVPGQLEGSFAAPAGWEAFVNSMHFSYPSRLLVEVRWEHPEPGRAAFSIEGARFYLRGDTTRGREEQEKHKLIFGWDSVGQDNERFFQNAVLEVARVAGFDIATWPRAGVAASEGKVNG
jgi:hypothetical protein